MAQSPGSVDSNKQPQGRLIPIFCTADIPVKTLNQILEKDAEYRNEDSYRLLYITDYSNEALAAINDTSSKPPVEAFSSPFIGMSLRQLHEIYIQKFQNVNRFSRIVFYVLDENTAKDESIVLVEAHDPAEVTEDNNGTNIWKATFYAARQVATYIDIGKRHLIEDRDPMQFIDDRDLPMDL